MKSRLIISSAAILTLLALGTSCQKDGSEAQMNGSTDSSMVNMSPAVSGIATQSGPWTKGTLINDYEAEGAVIPLATDSTFFVAAWDLPSSGDPVLFIPSGTPVKYFTTSIAEGVNRNMWSTTDSEGKLKEYVWKQNQTKVFDAWSNLPSESSVEATTEGMTLTHTVPEKASEQKDILMGIYSGEGMTGNPAKLTGTASITFSHPMASVALTMGDVTGCKTFSIKNISIEGIYAGGTAVMTIDSAAKEDPSERFVWEPLEKDGKVVTSTVEQDITATPESGSGKRIGEPFIVIPQSFSSDSSERIKVSVNADGKNIDLYYSVNGDEWKSGHIATYKICFNGHEGIQLWEDGPYWATTNVGARYPEEYGWFFSWGNVTGYVPVDKTWNATGSYFSYTWKTADGQSVLEGGFTQTNYFGTAGAGLNTDITVDANHDAAFKHMGEKWRIPTKAEFDALLANTVQTRLTRNGHSGYLFTGKGDYAGRSIFLPTSGFGNADQYNDEGVTGIYWSSTKDSPYANGTAWRLRWSRNSELFENPAASTDTKYYGRNIRPVENF